MAELTKEQKMQGATEAHVAQEKAYGKPEDSADVRVVGWEGYQKLREEELAGNRLVGEPRVEKGYGKKLDRITSDGDKLPAAEEKSTSKKTTDKK